MTISSGKADLQPVEKSKAGARWVWSIPLVAFLFTVSAVYFAVRNYPVVGHNPDSMLDPLALVIALIYSALGAFIAQRRPGNRIAWIFMMMGLLAGLYQFSMQYSVYAFVVLQQALPLAHVMNWVQGWAWYVPLNLMVLLVLLYPNGRPLSPVWGTLALLVAMSVPAMIILTYIHLWPYRGPLMYMPDAQLPLDARQSQETLRSYWIFIAGLPLLVGMPAAVISLIMRLKRAGQIERQQIKWFLYTGSLFTAGLVLTLSLLSLFGNEDLGNLFWMALLPILAVPIPVAVSMAILRYRLYEIDVLIRRTLVYSVLTSILAGVYLVSVILLQNLLIQLTGSESPVAVVISTMLIAALFNPLRRRLQQLIDRRFYRNRYNTDILTANLTLALQSEVDLDRLADSLIAAVENAVQPESVSLWLRRTEE